MSPADFHPLLHARPFKPFRVITSDGMTYDVTHPDLCLAGYPSVIIGYSDARDQPVAYTRYDVVSMRHIVRLEPTPEPVEQT